MGGGDSSAAELANLEHLAGREWADWQSKWQVAVEQLATAEKALALTQQHATNLAGQVEHWQNQTSDCREQAAREIVRVREEGEARLQALKQTWSWKLTMPVRALRRFLQRCGVRC